MKYFTKEWCFSNLGDYEIDRISKSYKDYIDSTHAKLPFVLKILAKSLNLHDGRLMKVSYIQNEGSLLLDGIFGDLQTGYFFLQIRYLGVSGLSEEVLRAIFKDQVLEILSDEIELFSENYFSHKMLFSSKNEIDIQFKDIQIGIRTATSKDYKKYACHFEVV